jgi:preprotein translocase subunit SecE
VLAVFAGIGLGLAVAALSEPGRQFIAFSREAITEARKVVWPTRKETLQATGAVFFLVITMALFLWLVDAGLLWIVKTLMGQSG